MKKALIAVMMSLAIAVAASLSSFGASTVLANGGNIIHVACERDGRSFGADFVPGVNTNMMGEFRKMCTLADGTPTVNVIK